MQLTIKIYEIRGTCPVYKEGEEFYIEKGYKLVSKNILCMHSLCSIMPYYVALSKGINPKELGLSKTDKEAYVQCLDPCNYTGGGTVIFKITKIPNF